MKLLFLSTAAELIEEGSELGSARHGLSIEGWHLNLFSI
jgi:hypothetical protein